MKHCYALTCLTVALCACVSGCGGKKKLHANKAHVNEPVVATAAALPSSALVAEAPAQAAPMAIPVAAAGVGGAAGNQMAVVILMLPAASAAPTPGGAPGAPRTYKLSLSANADSATIQVDGQPAVTAPVQRVFPAAAPGPRAPAIAAPRAPAVSTLRAPAVAVPRLAAPPVRSRYVVQEPAAPSDPPDEGTMQLGEAHARQARRAAISTAMRPPLPPPVMINPNGAPIID